MISFSTKKTFKIAPAVITALVLSGCATTNDASQIETSRYLGYTSSVTANGKTVFGRSSLITYDQFQNELRMSKLALGVKSRENFVGAGNTLYTIAFADGSFETNFGKPTEFIFSYQICENITGLGTVNVQCADQKSTEVHSIRKTILLKGGESLHASLPGGIEWKYLVLDQSSPRIGY